MMNPVADYSAWLHTLPTIAQPIVGPFLLSLPPWLAIAVFERRWIAAHGPSPSKKIPGWLALLVGGALFYFKGRYPDVQAILDWPDKHIPGWHEHWWQMVVGIIAAGLVAKWLEAAFASLFRRGGRHGGGQGGIRIGVTPVRRVWVERD